MELFVHTAVHGKVLLADFLYGICFLFSDSFAALEIVVEKADDSQINEQVLAGESAKVGEYHELYHLVLLREPLCLLQCSQQHLHLLARQVLNSVFPTHPSEDDLRQRHKVLHGRLYSILSAGFPHGQDKLVKDREQISLYRRANQFLAKECLFD